MQIPTTYCDNCHNVIRPGDYKYVFASNKVKEIGGKKFSNFYEVLTYYQNEAKNVKTNEICEDCERVLEYFFNMKKAELEEVKTRLKTIWEKKEFERGK